MTEYSNESSYQNEKLKISCHFKENGSKKGKVHSPFLLYSICCSRVEMLRFQLNYRLEKWKKLFNFFKFLAISKFLFVVVQMVTKGKSFYFNCTE